jgi:hypothetical protein
VSAGNDPDERALAGAVLPEEGVDLAGPQVEVDAPERASATEGLRQAAQFEERGGHWGDGR